MYQIKIFTLTGGGVKKMEKEIEDWLKTLRAHNQIYFMTQSESNGSLIITFLYE